MAFSRLSQEEGDKSLDMKTKSFMISIPNDVDIDSHLRDKLTELGSLRRDSSDSTTVISKMGCAVIFNCENFDNAAYNRQGSNHDERGLSIRLQNLHFDVLIFKDFTSEQMENAAAATAKLYDHGRAKYFLCFILSHGRHKEVDGVNGKVFKESILGRDSLWGKAITIETFLEKFSGDNCKGLSDKPRLFFVQACRGTQIDLGATLCPTNGDGEDKQQSDEDPSYEDAGPDDTSDSSCQIPPNFMVMYATPPGYKAYRRTESGTRFVSSLISLFKFLHDENEASQGMSLMCGLTAVIRNVAKCDDKWKQVPIITSRLKEDVYFVPGDWE